MGMRVEGAGAMAAEGVVLKGDLRLVSGLQGLWIDECVECRGGLLLGAWWVFSPSEHPQAVSSRH